MSFLEKLKNIHSGPPVPPRKTGSNAEFGWPENEFDDEEGDTYEAPPCKPQVKMPQRQMEEDIYLDKRSTPAPPSRLSNAPKPQQRNNFSFEANTRKPPEIDRNEKPGKKKVPPPPLPAPEEDVYLDPNGEEESSDDVYLEPTEACFVNNVKRSSKHCEHEDKEWFAGDCNRTTSIELLQRVNKDGAFLVRCGSAQSPRQPYTLAVLYQQKVFNVPIRFLEDTRGYALGKEGKKSEESFASLDEMISHHKNNQLLLIDSKSQAKHVTHLIHPAHTVSLTKAQSRLTQALLC